MRLLWIILSILFILTPAYAGNSHLYLQIYQPEREEILLKVPVSVGDRFQLRYTHSSDLTPIVDHFVIVGPDKIILEEEEFLWYGSGLEFQSTENARVILDGHRTRVLLNRHFTYIPIRVGRVAGHLVKINNRSIPLLSLTGGGEPVWIRIVNDNVPEQKRWNR